MIDLPVFIDRTDRQLSKQVNDLLAQEGLHCDPCIDYTCGLFDETWNLLATGSCYKNTLRCLAVRRDLQGKGLLAQIVGHLITFQAQRGNTHLFLYTKKKNLSIFRNLGFYAVLESDGIILMENCRTGFQDYLNSLYRIQSENLPAAAVVMNANPFTLGHLHLVEKAASENGIVYLFVLSEENSFFPAVVRKRLVAESVSSLSNVIVLDSGPYMISNATFPSYFVRDSAEAMRIHARMDVQIFGHIAKRLNIVRRYVGEEPTSQVTALYNRTLSEILPDIGIDCRVIPRLKIRGRTVSASVVRQAIQKDCLDEIMDMLPSATRAFLRSAESDDIIASLRAAKEVVHH